jgi:hypothetical protein
MSLAHGAEIVKRMEVTHDAFLGGRLTMPSPPPGFAPGSIPSCSAPPSGQRPKTCSIWGPAWARPRWWGWPIGRNCRPFWSSPTPQWPPWRDKTRGQRLFHSRRDADPRCHRSGRARGAAGLKPDHFGSSSPIRPSSRPARPPPPPARLPATCRAEALDVWVKTAASHAAPGGEIIFIHVASEARRAAAELRRPVSAPSPCCRSPRAKTSPPPHPDPRHQGLPRAADPARVAGAAHPRRPRVPPRIRGDLPRYRPAPLVMSPTAAYITAGLRIFMREPTGLNRLAEPPLPQARTGDPGGAPAGRHRRRAAPGPSQHRNRRAAARTGPSAWSATPSPSSSIRPAARRSSRG